MKLLKSSVFYGWHIIGSAFLILFFVQGTRSVFGVLFKPIIQEFGWNRGDVSLAALVNMIVFALTLTAVGRLYDRYGARKVLFFATILLAGGHIGIGLVTTYRDFLILDGLVVAIGFGGASIPLFAVLATKWFFIHRGIAISIALAGGCLGQFVLVPVATLLVESLNWRGIFICIGLSILCVNSLLIWKIIRNHPRDLGLTALGQSTVSDIPIPPLSTANRQSNDLTLLAAMRTSPFWLFLIVMFICGGGDYLVLLHLVPMVTDQGISPEIAAKMLSWYGLLSLAGILIAGRASDKIGDKIPILLTFLLRGVLFFYILKSQTTLAFYIFSLGFGFTMMVTAPLTTTLMGRLYGLTHLGLITGVITTVHHMGGGIWAYLGGVMFDSSGDYRIVLTCYGACSLFAVVCTLFIRTTPVFLKKPACD